MELHLPLHEDTGPIRVRSGPVATGRGRQHRYMTRAGLRVARPPFQHGPVTEHNMDRTRRAGGREREESGESAHGPRAEAPSECSAGSQGNLKVSCGCLMVESRGIDDATWCPVSSAGRGWGDPSAVSLAGAGAGGIPLRPALPETLGSLTGGTLSCEPRLRPLIIAAAARAVGRCYGSP